MTITSQSNLVTYNCDSQAIGYPIFFYWLANAHLHVTLITVADGTRLPLTDGVDYTATGAGNLNGGYITPTVAYGAAYQIEIKRVVPIIQPDNYIAGSILPAETVEKDFDYGIMVSQQLDQRLGSIEQSGAGGGIALVNLPGSGVGVYAGQVGTTYNFKKLIGAGDLTITDRGTELLLSVGGVTGALLIVNNLTDVADRQASLNNLTNAAAAPNEYVLTRDTATGNAVWKVPTGGGGGGITYPGTTHQFLRGDGAFAWELKDAFSTGPYAGGGGGGAALVISDSTNMPAIWLNQKGANANVRLWRLGVVNSSGNSTFHITTFNDDGATGYHFPLMINRVGANIGSMQLLIDGGRLIVGNLADDAITLVQVGGSMRFDGAARVMSADTQNAGAANRFVFQDSQVNAATSLNLAPNGTALISNVKAHNAFPITNAAFVSQSISGTVALLNSGHNGSGTTLPLSLNIDGTACLQLTAPAGRLLLGTVASGLPTDDTTSALQVNGDIHIIGTGRKIKGNFSDAVAANRLSFQTDLANSYTSMNVLPNGTGNQTFIQCFNNSDLTQPLSYGDIRIGPASMTFSSNQQNSGPVLPMTFTVGTTRMRITPAGLLTIGEPTDDGVSILQANGTAKAKSVVFVAEIDDGNVTGAALIIFTVGQYHKATMTGACTFSFTPPSGPAVVHLKLTQDATGSRVMTLPAGKWPGNYAAADKLLSTAANAIDLLTAKWDGAAWWYTLTKAWA